MFPILAIICFALAVLEAPIDLNLTALGLVFVAAWCLVGNWPITGRLIR